MTESTVFSLCLGLLKLGLARRQNVQSVYVKPLRYAPLLAGALTNLWSLLELQ